MTLCVKTKYDDETRVTQATAKGSLAGQNAKRNIWARSNENQTQLCNFCFLLSRAPRALGSSSLINSRKFVNLGKGLIWV